MASGFVEQVGLDLCLLGAIFPQRASGAGPLLLGLGTVAVHPDRLAVQEVVHLPP